MKHYKVLIISLLLIPFLLASQTNKNRYEINGRINLDSGKIYLVHYDNAEKRIVDSSKIKNQTFYFKGNINGFSNRFFIKLNPKEKQNADSLNAVQIQIEPSKIKLYLKMGEFSNYKITNCKSCDELERFTIKTKSDEYDTLFETLKQTNDSLKIVELEKKIKPYEENLIKEKIQYIKLHPNSMISPYLLYWIENDLQLNDFKNLYNHLSNYQKNSSYGKEIKKDINNNKIIQSIGKKAYQFKTFDVNGNEIILKELTKKSYTLLNFWASWCEPCREESTFLNQLLATYNEKGFNIVGVTADTNVNAWKNAINKDKTQNWIHLNLDSKLIDKKTIDCEIISNEYKIISLPTLILIDKSGFIIGIYDSGTKVELEEKLKSIFK